MLPPLTTNTKAILLLTAPLMVGPGTRTADLLTPGEYKAFAQRLHEIGRQPADLLGDEAASVLEQSKSFAELDRLKRLLERGLQLGQAVDRWNQRAIWVVSRADPEYPRRLKARLKGNAPAVLYGCGDLGALDEGGLAIVGSRDVDDELVQYAMGVGSLAARANRQVVSGGAKGIDQAAMRGALEAGGRVCGVLTDSLERQSMTREHRDMLVEGQLVLVSPYDPSAGFNRGHAMQRNKVVYAFADAALVVSSDVEKGGTWAGAIEQLKKLQFVPVYVRSTGKPQRGLDALIANGALAWPSPDSPDAMQDLLDAPAAERAETQLSLVGVPAPGTTPQVEPRYMGAMTAEAIASVDELGSNDSEYQDTRDVRIDADPAERLFAAAAALITELAQQGIKDGELAEALKIPKPLAKAWLDRMIETGALQKTKKPARYVTSPKTLF